VVVNTSVFDAFPSAVVSGWTLLTVSRGTEVGVEYEEYGSLNVIVDEVAMGNLNLAPEAETLNNDLLIYVKPTELPSTRANVLISSYYAKDPDGFIYEIKQVGVGKNQETGTVEHVELILRQTELYE